MSLISFSEYLTLNKESSASTRSKTAAANGLGPDVADVFGHSTPPPWQAEKLLKKLKKGSKKDKDIQEKRDMRPDYSFDRLVRKAASTAGEIDKEIQKGEKDSDKIDKEKEQRKDKPDDKVKSTRPENRQDNQEEISKEVKPSRPNQGHTVTGRDRTPDPKKDLSQRTRKDKRDVADAEITEEQAWLKLLDTSFDRYLS